MADEHIRAETPNRGLSRALAAPVRAVSRILTGANAGDATPDGGTRTGHSAIVDCAIYEDGIRQPGEWNYAEALTEARRTRNGFVWLGRGAAREYDALPSSRPTALDFHRYIFFCCKMGHVERGWRCEFD